MYYFVETPPVHIIELLNIRSASTKIGHISVNYANLTNVHLYFQAKLDILAYNVSN